MLYLWEVSSISHLFGLFKVGKVLCFCFAVRLENQVGVCDKLARQLFSVDYRFIDGPYSIILQIPIISPVECIYRSFELVVMILREGRSTLNI